MKQIFKISVTWLLFCTLAHAQVVAQLPPNGPHFAKVGETLFVSGNAAYWMGAASQAIPSGFEDDEFARQWSADPQRRIKRLVLVNAFLEGTGSNAGIRNVSDRAIGFWKRRVQFRGIETVVLGRCDHFCMMVFQFGIRRTAGQDVDGVAPYFELQPSMDLETRKLSLTFPSVDFAKFESGNFEQKVWRAAAIKAFSKPTDLSGGLIVPLTGAAEFCESRAKRAGCEVFEGLNLRTMNAVTEHERITIELPKHMPAPSESSFAKLQAISMFTAEARQTYERFLQLPYPRFAAANLGLSTVTGARNAGKAIQDCETKTGGDCALYAVDDSVVWQASQKK